MKEEFPQEYYVDISNNDSLLGRVSVNKIKSHFSCEVDIVFKESRKIFKHIGQGFDYEDKTEAIDQGVMKLSSFLSSVK
jgi:hypothetical protein